MWGMVEVSGLVGVMMGRGAADRDILLCFRVWAVGEENMGWRTVDDEAEAAMSVSESICRPGVCWPSGWAEK